MRRPFALGNRRLHENFACPPSQAAQNPLHATLFKRRNCAA